MDSQLMVLISRFEGLKLKKSSCKGAEGFFQASPKGKDTPFDDIDYLGGGFIFFFHPYLEK